MKQLIDTIKREYNAKNWRNKTENQ
jgi:hypothetical protein